MGRKKRSLFRRGYDRGGAREFVEAMIPQRWDGIVEGTRWGGIVEGTSL